MRTKTSLAVAALLAMLAPPASASHYMLAYDSGEDMEQCPLPGHCTAIMRDFEANSRPSTDCVGSAGSYSACRINLICQWEVGTLATTTGSVDCAGGGGGSCVIVTELRCGGTAYGSTYIAVNDCRDLVMRVTASFLGYSATASSDTLRVCVDSTGAWWDH